MTSGGFVGDEASLASWIFNLSTKQDFRGLELEACGSGREPSAKDFIFRLCWKESGKEECEADWAVVLAYAAYVNESISEDVDGPARKEQLESLKTRLENALNNCNGFQQMLQQSGVRKYCYKDNSGANAAAAELKKKLEELQARGNIKDTDLEEFTITIKYGSITRYSRVHTVSASGLRIAYDISNTDHERYKSHEPDSWQLIKEAGDNCIKLRPVAADNQEIVDILNRKAFGQGLVLTCFEKRLRVHRLCKTHVFVDCQQQQQQTAAQKAKKVERVCKEKPTAKASAFCYLKLVKDMQNTGGEAAAAAAAAEGRCLTRIQIGERAPLCCLSIDVVPVAASRLCKGDNSTAR